MIHVVVDSAASIPPDVARALSLHIVPIKVVFGEDTFLDGVNLDSDTFYERLTGDHTLPKTSQPSAGEFLELFQRLTADGSQVLSILMSHQMSGTLSSAEAAREMLPDRSIHIFDSLSISIGEGLLAIAEPDMAAQGQSIEAILARLQRMRSQMRVSFVVDTLEFLQRGGRIGGATALLGTMLKIKPLLHIVNGRIEPLEKVRTRQKALERMLDIMGEQVGPDARIWGGVGHTHCPGEAAEMEAILRSRFNCARVLIGEAGPTIGTHAGPGVLGIATCPVE